MSLSKNANIEKFVKIDILIENLMKIGKIIEIGDKYEPHKKMNDVTTFY